MILVFFGCLMLHTIYILLSKDYLYPLRDTADFGCSILGTIIIRTYMGNEFIIASDASNIGQFLVVCMNKPSS